MDKTMEDTFDAMLEAQCEQMAKEKTEAPTEAQEEAKDVLNGFLEYIKSKKFINKCKETGKKHNLDYKIVKNAFISGILGKIANTLGLVIDITLGVIEHVTEFICAIINRVCNLVASVCKSIVRVLTLNCGTI